MEIVYCGGCGKALLGDDFNRGLAQFLDNRPWCSECKPPAKDPITSTRKQGSSAKHARIPTARRETPAPAPAASRGALLGIGGAVLAVVVLGVFFAASGSSPPPVQRTARPPVDPPRPAPDWSESARLLRELESFASLAAPDKVLSRCEELAPKFRGSPQEARFRQIEKAAMEAKRARDAEGQVAREAEAIRKLIDGDPRFARADEVLRRLRSLRELAGPRASEIDRTLADYQKARQASPHEKHLGPYAADEQGYLRNWLLLGVFPNENEKGLDVDFLKTESTHAATAGGTVGGARWAAYESPDAAIDFLRPTPLQLQKPRDNIVVYAACLVQVPDYAASEFLLGSDDGVAIWLDGKPIARNDRKRSLKLDEDRHAVPLSAGVHRLLVKVVNHSGDFAFSLRIVMPDGKPVPGLRIWN